jgi:hypothetical protein
VVVAEAAGGGGMAEAECAEARLARVFGVEVEEVVQEEMVWGTARGSEVVVGMGGDGGAGRRSGGERGERSGGRRGRGRSQIMRLGSGPWMPIRQVCLNRSWLRITLSVSGGGQATIRLVEAVGGGGEMGGTGEVRGAEGTAGGLLIGRAEAVGPWSAVGSSHSCLAPTL